MWPAKNRWNLHPCSAEPVGRFCSAQKFERVTIWAEGPAVHPAKGEALVYRPYRVLYSAVSCGLRPNGRKSLPEPYERYVWE